jgi:hypothetical protein
MTDKLMYFGTQERMTWIKCFTTESGIGKVGWSVSSQFINGGASVRQSATSHKEYTVSWPLASAADTAAITDYADKVYGTGLIYFLDPFSLTTNVLPLHWSVPALAIEDAPVVNGSDIRPTGVSTAANTQSFPTTSAVYTFDATNTFKTLWVPLPAGYTFHFGAFGSASGTAAVTLNGVAATLLSPTSSARVNTTITGVPGVTISFSGIGTLTLAGMMAQVRPTGEAVPVGGFISGRGHSGCRFSTAGVAVNGFSAPQALDFQSVSATLIETGDWE